MVRYLLAVLQVGSDVPGEQLRRNRRLAACEIIVHKAGHENEMHHHRDLHQLLTIVRGAFTCFQIIATDRPATGKNLVEW